MKQDPALQPYRTAVAGGLPPFWVYPAEEILLHHEMYDDTQLLIDFAMDMHNNTVGLKCGADKNADCGKACDEAL